MSIRRSSSFAAVALLLTPMWIVLAQSTVTVSPFVSYVPSAATNPLAGFSLTFGGTTGLALRGGAEISVSNPDSAARAAGGNRPWGADADVMLFLGGLGGGATVFSRTLSPYVFSGIFLMGGDSAGTNVVNNGWSYGLGTAIPLGLDADLFAEARWRMNRYVLPTADDAPDSRSEMRFGLSFHVGGGASAPPPRRHPPRRHRQQLLNDDDDPEYVASPAPAPQVVVVQPAPAPAAPPPQVVVVQQPAPPPPQVVVVQQPAAEPRRSVNINVPLVILGGGRTRVERETRVIVKGSDCSRRSRCRNDRHYSVPLRNTSSGQTIVQVAPATVTTEVKAKRPSRRP